MNILTFSFWYWELDGGGPGRRLHHGYTSTALSPTATLVLSVRAKLLLMSQALIALTVLAIIAARAMNTL